MRSARRTPSDASSRVASAVPGRSNRRMLASLMRLTISWRSSFASSQPQPRLARAKQQGYGGAPCHKEPSAQNLAHLMLQGNQVEDTIAAHDEALLRLRIFGVRSSCKRTLVQMR